MKLDITAFTSRFQIVIKFVTTYSLILFLIVLASLSGFLVIRVGNLSQAEPSQEQVDTKLAETKTTKVDQGVLSVVEELKSRNKSTTTSFDTTRNNPFEDR